MHGAIDQDQFAGDLDGRFLNAFLLMQLISTIHKSCAESPVIEFERYFENNVGGMFMEFGVASGQSITKIANRNPDKTIYGFDSFKGLPEKWDFHPAELFTRDKPPEVPKNVELTVGLFQDTLVPFLAEHPGPISFVHIDCDLYSSTKFVLDTLKDRFILGTVIAFDEIYYLYKNLRNEARAFAEFLAETGFAYQCIGHFNNDKAGFRMAPPMPYDVEVGLGVEK